MHLSFVSHSHLQMTFHPILQYFQPSYVLVFHPHVKYSKSMYIFECCEIYIFEWAEKGETCVENSSAQTSFACTLVLPTGQRRQLSFFFSLHVTSVINGKLPPVSVFKYKAVSQVSPASTAAAVARGSVLTPPPGKPHAQLPLFHICSDVGKMPRGRRQPIDAPCH